jgi:hypothetical protein
MATAHSRSLVDQVLGHGPWRVFLSHTSELRDHPAQRSFAAAAEAAVIRAGHAVTDMAYFTAGDAGCVEYCTRMVARSDVYVGIIGLRYGAVVSGSPERSFTELEFETATALGLSRLLFLVRADSPALPRVAQAAGDAARQAIFRGRLQATDAMVPRVSSPAELELQVLHALGELRAEAVARAALASIRTLKARADQGRGARTAPRAAIGRPRGSDRAPEPTP